MENRPPTQSQKANTRSGLTPKATARSGAAETAAKCRRAPSSPRPARSQSRAASALARVSSVVKVLETAMTRVVSGSRPVRAWTISAPSTLATKRRSIDGSRGFSASHTSRGPRSEPPMPMCRMALKALPVAPRIVPSRTPSARARMRWRPASTSALTGTPSACRSDPSGARRALCSTARPSDRLTMAPPNRPSRAASTPLARTSSSTASSPSRDQLCLARSRVRPAASTVRRASRSGSAANRSRMGVRRDDAAARSSRSQAAAMRSAAGVDIRR